MASKIETEMTERSREGWHKFCRVIGIFTAHLIVVLGLLAIFLL